MPKKSHDSWNGSIVGTSLIRVCWKFPDVRNLGLPQSLLQDPRVQGTAGNAAIS